MAVIIGYRVKQGKTVLGRHIIDAFIRMADMIFRRGDHSLVTFEETAHILQEPGLVFRSHAVVLHPCGQMKEHFLGSVEKMILRQKFSRHTVSHKMETIHMIVGFPETDRFQSQQRTDSRRIIEFHNTFYSGLMKRFDKITEFILRIAGRTVCPFGRKVKSRNISPVIDSVRISLVSDHPLCLIRRSDFREFVGRHQFHSGDPQFLPVGDHSHKP